MKPKVYLTGGRHIQWALVDDFYLTQKALAPFVEFTDANSAEIIHATYIEGLRNLSESVLNGRKIICHMIGEPFRYLKTPDYIKPMSVVGHWISHSKQSFEQLRGVGLNSSLVPYGIDIRDYYCMDKQSSRIKELRCQWNIPENCYLIGNFHRDTEGSDLITPKYVKGPDVFLEIVKEVVNRKRKVHVVLAGPRRFWIMKELKRNQIPYTFIGAVANGDDIGINVLSKDKINELYNLIDLYVVSSRTEGGPRTVLESVSAKCKVISTRVGMSPDILGDECLYSFPYEAANIIDEDIKNNMLNANKEKYYQSVIDKHTTNSLSGLFEQAYCDISKIDNSLGYTGYRTNMGGSVSANKKMVVSIWHNFVKPPWGGGNQFLIALKKALIKNDVHVVDNELSNNVDVHLLNSIHFDVDKFANFRKDNPIRVVHRIDGPISLSRGASETNKDALCFDINKNFASMTVVQSSWTLKEIIKMGYAPMNPIIIHNAVDGGIFNKNDKLPFDKKRKIRLISTSWSDNPRKGGMTYKWMDANLDWKRFEYRFIGRSSEKYNNINMVAPVNSELLSQYLKDSDIFVTASQIDSCPNSVIEGMACGLPVLYYNNGGHPEIVGQGGLPFTGNDEIPRQLDNLISHYEAFQKLIVINSIDSIAKAYKKTFEMVIAR